MSNDQFGEHRQSKLSKAAAELALQQRRIIRYIDAHHKNTNDIISSLSYRLGYVLTYPLRKLIDLTKGKKTHLFNTIHQNETFIKGFDESITDIICSIAGKKIHYALNPNFQGYIDTLNEQQVLTGWYRDVHNTHNRLEIQVVHQNKIIAKTICDKYRLDLAQKNIGDGHYGFELDLSNHINEIKGEFCIKIKNGMTIGAFQITDKNIKQVKFDAQQLIDTVHSNNYKKYDFTFEGIEKEHLRGWIVNTERPDKKVDVLLFREREFLRKETANIFRSDVAYEGRADGYCGFAIKIPYEKLIDKPGTFSIVTEDGFYLGESEWNPDLHKVQISVEPFKEKQTLHLPIDDGFSPINLVSFNFKIAVHIHVFYADVFEEICTQLRSIPKPFDLLVSSSKNIKQDINKIIQKTDLKCSVLFKQVENRGRDIAPMIIEFGEQLQRYDLALHLHTKKTAHNENLGSIWMQHILKCLLSDQFYLNHIFKLFNSNEQLGIIAPSLIDDLIRFYKWGKNYKLALQFFEDIEVDVDLITDRNIDIEFPAGTMFWFKPAALEKLLDHPFTYKNFPKEPIEPDGTIAHAIERCIYYIAKDSGYDYQTVAPLPPSRKLTKDKISLSIIIPVYNAKKWLTAAIQSVVTQNNFLYSYEIILIDNNSKDGSDILCKQLQALYPFIQYYKEIKKGAGNARNLGLKHAKGDYILFLDADDILSKYALQNLFDKANKSGAELVVSPLVIYNENGFKEASPIDYTLHQNTLAMDQLKQKEINIEEEKLLYALFSDFGPCAKMYKRSFLEQYQITFPENTNYEDNIFIYHIYLKAKHIEICGMPTYFYRKFEEEKGNTQSTSSDKQSMIEQCLIIRQLQAISNQNQYRVFKKYMDASYIKKLYWFLNVVNKLPATNSQFFVLLHQILSNISTETIEWYGRQYVDFFKSILAQDYQKAKSIF